MDEEKNQMPEEQKEREPYTPAPLSKRVAAWIGVIAMVILVILYTYSIATGSILKW